MFELIDLNEPFCDINEFVSRVKYFQYTSIFKPIEKNITDSSRYAEMKNVARQHNMSLMQDILELLDRTGDLLDVVKQFLPIFFKLIFDLAVCIDKNFPKISFTF
jgi:hypothetical protein